MARQECSFCHKITDNGPDVPALRRCPKCLRKFPSTKPHIISPKTAALGAGGG